MNGVQLVEEWLIQEAVNHRIRGLKVFSCSHEGRQGVTQMIYRIRSSNVSSHCMSTLQDISLPPYPPGDDHQRDGLHNPRGSFPAYMPNKANFNSKPYKYFACKEFDSKLDEIELRNHLFKQIQDICTLKSLCEGY